MAFEYNKEGSLRPTWDEYFVGLTEAVSKRATCDRGRSGCVIVRDKRILVSGYVGSPVGFPHCDDVGHQIKTVTHEDGKVTSHCVRTIHAEQNAICQAARDGISIDGGTIYTIMTRCRTCAMLIINCGLKRVVSIRKYQAGWESEEMFKKAGIVMDFKYTEEQKYPEE